MKNYLVLEDNLDLAETYKQRLKGVADVTVVDNLIAFDERIFDFPGLSEYDKVIIDLAIPIGELDLKDLLEDIPDMPDKITQLNGKIPLLGWDYFYNRINTDENCKRNMKKFVIISGHASLFKEYLDKNKIKLSITLIDKTDNDLSKKLLNL